MTSYLPILIVLSFLSCGLAQSEKPTNAISGVPATDTTRQFNPDGYFFPTTSVTYKEYHFDRLEIFTKDLDTPTVSVLFVNRANGKEVEVMSTQYKIGKDETAIFFTNSQLGISALTGKFLGVKGPFEDNIESNKTVVFKGLLTYASGQTIPIEFTWWEGD